MDTKPSLPKRLLKWIGIPLAALALLVALAPTLMPTGWIKDLIASESRKALGAPVTVDRISLSWLSGATLEGIEVPNAAGYSDAPLARIAKVHVEPDLASLFGNPVRVKKIEISGLEASVERRPKDGAWNAQALVPAPAASAPPAPAGKLPSVRVDALVVTGRVKVLGSGKTLEVKDLRVDASAPDLAAGILQAKVQGTLVGGSASWDLKADADTQGGQVRANLALEGKGLAGLLQPLADLPVVPDLQSGKIRLEVILRNSEVHAELREGSLSGLSAGGLFSAESSALSFQAHGPLSGGEIKVQAELACKGVGIPCPGGRIATVASVRIAPKLVLDPLKKSFALEACPLEVGPFTGSVEGKLEGPVFSVRQTLKGNLAEIPQAVSGLVPEGAAFTGALDSRLEVSGDAEGMRLEGATTIPGFSIRASGVGAGPKVDLRLEEKLGWSSDRLSIESLKVSAGPDLNLSLSGSLEDPKNLGQMDLAGSVRADLGALAAVVAGYFRDSGVACKGRLEGDFRARGTEGQATLKGKVELRGGHFQGGVFGPTPLEVPEAHAAMDLDLDRSGGLRVNVRTAELSTPYASASLKNAFLNGDDLKADLDLDLKDLDAASRLLRGPVPALQPWNLGGSGRLTASVSGTLKEARLTASGTMERLSVSGPGLEPLGASSLVFKAEGSGPAAGPWTVAALTLRGEGLKEIERLSLELKDACVDAGKKSCRVGSLAFDSPLAAGTWTGTASWAEPSVDGELKLERADLGRLKLPASGILALEAKVKGGLKDLKVEGTLSGRNVKAKGFATETLSCGPFKLSASPAAHSLRLESFGALEAPGLGLKRLTLASASVKDWIALTGIEVKGLALDADTGPWKAYLPAQVRLDGPVSVKVPSVTGDLKSLAFEVSVDAKAEGQELTARLAGTLAPDAVSLRKADLGFGEYRLSLKAGSVIPLDPARDANLEIDRTTVDLARLPMIKGFTGRVTVEGSVRGPLADLNRVDGNLSVGLEGVAGSLGDIPFTADGELKATKKAVSAPSLRLTVKGEPLTVSADVRDPMDAPTGTVTVAGGAFDLDKLLPKGAAAGTGAPSPASPPAKKTDLNLTGLLPHPLEKADLDLTFTLKEVVYKGNRLSGLTAKTTLKRQHLVTTIDATVNEGPVRIGLDLDASQKKPPLVATFQAKDVRLDVELPPVAKYFLPFLAGGKGIQGKLSVDPFRLEGTGASWEALRQNIHSAGQGHLHVSEGEFKGVPFFQLLAKVTGQGGFSDFRFSAIDSHFSVQDQKVDVRTEIQSSSGVISSGGWVGFDLMHEMRTVCTGDFLRTPNEEASKILEIAMSRGGILSDGPITDPRIQLDKEAILKELAKEAAKEALKRGLLDGLFGR